MIIYNALVEPRKAEEIARHCGVSKATVYDVISFYNRQGVASVETAGKGGRRHQYLSLGKEEQFLTPFFAQAERGEIATVAKSSTPLRKKSDARSMTARSIGFFAVTAGANGCRVPGIQKLTRKRKSNSKKFPAQVEAAVTTREAGDERPVLIMAQDEGCFGRMSRAKRCWAPPGMRPHVPAQVVREYTYAYAAVVPALGQMVSLISTEMMNLFLEQVSQTFSKHFIVMQVDGGGWHKANDLIIPENMRLISQPAYSPELNPVEHIWDDLREKYFHNRIFSSLELLIDVLCQGLTALADDAERLRSLTGFPHLKVTI